MYKIDNDFFIEEVKNHPAICKITKALQTAVLLPASNLKVPLDIYSNFSSFEVKLRNILMKK